MFALRLERTDNRSDRGPTARVDARASEPKRPAGEALIRVRVAGVCDTDLQLARGYMGFQGIPGHEFVGEVLESDSASWRGARVVGDINAGCGACADCLTDKGHHCANRTVLGILGRSGAFAERLTLPERCLVRVPDSVSDDAAVFAEPFAAALHVLDELAPWPASGAAPRATVLGDGKLGLLIAIALHTAGVRTTIVGHHDSKLAIARSAGIEGVLEAALTSAHGLADCVVEATGSSSGLTRALSLVRPRGLVVLKTTTADPSTVDLSPVVIHELRVVGSRCGDLARALEVMAAEKLDFTPLLEARYPLREADKALAHAARRGARKILVDA